MKALVKQFLDNQISRRGFMKKLTALGVSLASAEALLDGLISESFAQETAQADAIREVTGNGSDLMIESLLDAGVKYVFNGTGAGVNRFFDTLVTRPQMKNFLATNEGQCVAMAEGYHLASGELGVTIIPKAGLGNAAGNIYNALANRSSLLVITARESGEMANRYGDLELVDWEEVMDPFMKWSYRIRHLNRVPELTRRAITVARTAPGGVSFLQMNEELYEQEGTATLIASSKFHVTSKIRPKPEAIMDVAKMLLESQNPLITVGYEVTRAGANQKMVELADLLALRVTAGMSGFADFPTNHPLYLGSFSPWGSYNRDADFYMSIGSPMPDEARYVHRGPPPPKAKSVHISLEPEMLAIAYPSDANIVADAGQAISDLIEAIKSLATKERIDSIREERYDKVKEYTQGQRKRRMDGAKESWDKAPMSYGRVSTELNDLLEDDAIIIHEPLRGALDWFDLGYGNKTELGVAGSSILGWATGVALGAKIAKPDSQVVALTGDGSLMFQHNLWALSRHDAPVIVVVYNNRCYEGTRAPNWARGGPQVEAQKDMLNYLGDPDVDFAILAKAYGVDGEVVNNSLELKPAILRAIESTKNGKPYLLDVTVERWGPGGELTWHPETSVAAMRSRKI